jgi:hypothetical protein
MERNTKHSYAEKVKLVVEKIDELSQQQFSIAELNRHLEFDSNRYVRLLCRRGFLAPVFGRGRKITGFTRAAWPVPAEFFEKGAIGLTYYLQTWFRYYLQSWIDGRMRKVKVGPGRGDLQFAYGAGSGAALPCQPFADLPEFSTAKSN